MPQNPQLSLEFFPPNTEEMERRLWEAVTRLAPLKPQFVSVTYGAGGTTRERTHGTVKRILADTSLIPAAHLTCVGASQAEVNQVAQAYWDAGVRHIVALRGDPPAGGNAYTPHPGGYAYAADLVQGLKTLADFDISVAAFPEKHPDSPSFEHDIDVLKRKVDAGASRAITQYSFEPELFARYVERVRKAGITIPIIPGVLPIVHFGQMVKFSARCGATVPAWLSARFSGLDETPELRHRVAVETTVEYCKALLQMGAEHLHIYTLNRAELTLDIWQALAE